MRSNVNGLHIISPFRVPDSAFVKDCEIIDFMTSCLPKEQLTQMVKINTSVGIIPFDDKFNNLLEEKLDTALAVEKYKINYAATNIWKYWTEGGQNWLNVNAEVVSEFRDEGLLNISQKKIVSLDINRLERIANFW